jgi:hypothetical protein
MYIPQWPRVNNQRGNITPHVITRVELGLIVHNPPVFSGMFDEDRGSTYFSFQQKCICPLFMVDLALCFMTQRASSGPKHKRTEGRAPVWGSEFTSKDASLQRGMMVVLMQLFAAALVARRRYFIVAPRPFLAAPLVVRRRCLIVVPMPMPEAPHMYLIVVYRPFPAAPLAVRCMHMAVVPGPMPAAVASRCCRRILQQLVCACGS